LEDQFIEIYDENFDDVYRYVYVKIGNKWDAEDIVSETFRKAFEKFSSFQRGSSPKSWLMTIARNTIIDFYRKKKSVPIGEEMEFYLLKVSFYFLRLFLRGVNILLISIKYLHRQKELSLQKHTQVP